MPTTETLAIISLKGGAGKTTTAGMACATLVEHGHRVLGVDADPQGSLIRWQQKIRPKWDCIELPEGDLDVRLPGIVGDRWDRVVIDTPPTEHGVAIALSAAMAASHIVVPVAPTQVEYDTLPATRELLDKATELGAEYRHGVLLVKVRRTASAPYFANKILRDGWNLLRPHAPLWDEYAQAVGLPIVRASATGYGWAIAELMELEA